MASLEITLPSRRDMLEIWHFVAADNRNAADELLADIVSCCESIAETPRIGRRRPEIHRSLRSYPVGNYLVLYRFSPRKNLVQIVRVVHGARDLGRVFKRRNP